MAALIALPKPAATGGTAADIGTDISNTLDARERMHALHTMLTGLRAAARDAFLRTFCADLAALTTDPDKSFVDAEYAKFNTWKAADDEFGKRIEALESIARQLRERFAEFERAHRDEVIVLLQARIVTLRAQLQQEESGESALHRRIEALTDELDRIMPRSAGSAGAPAAEKAATSRAARKPARKVAKKAAKKL